DPDDPQLPRMPAALAEVLRKCFRENPAERWGTMSEAAEAVQRVYREEMRRDYSQPPPKVAGQHEAVTVVHDRKPLQGARWEDTREWLNKALKADGRDPGEAEKLLPARSGSRKAQALADLAAYEEAQRIYVRLIASGRKELEADLATLCMEKAVVHEDV